VCKAALALKNPDSKTARVFFQKWFRPKLVVANHKSLFTGYYEPVFSANLHKTKTYNVPVYGRPRDLVAVNLGMFKARLQGKYIYGRVVKGKLQHYYTRAGINKIFTHQHARILIFLTHHFVNQ